MVPPQGLSEERESQQIRLSKLNDLLDCALCWFESEMSSPKIERTT